MVISPFAPARFWDVQFLDVLRFALEVNDIFLSRSRDRIYKTCTSKTLISLILFHQINICDGPRVPSHIQILEEITVRELDLATILRNIWQPVNCGYILCCVFIIRGSHKLRQLFESSGFFFSSSFFLFSLSILGRGRVEDSIRIALHSYVISKRQNVAHVFVRSMLMF